jgi:hypothetical protein
MVIFYSYVSLPEGIWKQLKNLEAEENNMPYPDMLISKLLSIFHGEPQK